MDACAPATRRPSGATARLAARLRNPCSEPWEALLAHMSSNRRLRTFATTATVVLVAAAVVGSGAVPAEMESAPSASPRRAWAASSSASGTYSSTGRVSSE